ncbi:MAG TPA: PEP-CTERM sorting domain-containing protein [Pirellulales bacterium]|jgi:hypothetical protein
MTPCLVNYDARAFRSRRLLGFAATLIVAVFAAAPLHAAIESRAILKTFFETGDIPTQDQFGTVIDSMVSQLDDRYLLGLRTSSDGGAARLSLGDIVGPPTDFGPAAGLSGDWAGQTGYLGLAFTDSSASPLPNTYYGYLEVTAGAPGGSDLYPMYVSTFFYETSPNTPIAVTGVPEPSTLALGALCGAIGLCEVARRRRARRRTLAGASG